MFDIGPEDWGAISSWVMPKPQKMASDASWLNTRYYNVRIKGKWIQGKELGPFLHLSIYIYIYIYIYLYTIGISRGDRGNQQLFSANSAEYFLI